MTIKKAYQPIMDLLNANPDKKVSKILEAAIALCSAKTSRASGVSSFIADASGATVAIFDYYFKRWMPLVGENAVEFGAKKNTTTGFNPMSKEGVSNWTKQQRVAKTAQTELLTRVAAGEVAPTDIGDVQATIEAERKAIAETESGFATKEEVIAYLNENGVSVDAEPVAEAA